MDSPDTQTQRDMILEAGFARFRLHGIRRVTMDDIARELRISKKTIYRWFPDKRSLVQACADRLASTIMPGVQAALSGPGPVRDRMRAAMGHLAQVPRLITPVFIADVRADYPEVWAEIDRRRRTVISGYEKLLAEGRESGEIRPEINPKVAQLVIFAVITNVMVPEVLGAGEFTLVEAFQTVSTMLTRGILADERPAAGRPGRARRASASRPSRGSRKNEESSR